MTNDEIIFTFIGPSAGTMLWYYLLIILMTIGLIVLLITLLSSNWSRIASTFRGDNAFKMDESHVIAKQPRYLIKELRKDLIEKDDDE